MFMRLMLRSACRDPPISAWSMTPTYTRFEPDCFDPDAILV
jgi:hypothetical protein